MHAFQRSWSLFKSTWAVLAADREMMGYVFLSGLTTLLVTAAIGVLTLGALGASPELRQTVQATQQAFQEGTATTGEWIAVVAVMILYYLTMYSITNYFMTALAGAALVRFGGGDPTFSDGLRVASSRIGVIVGYSLVAATVGVALRLLRSRGRQNNNAVGALAAALGGAAWGIATFLVIPVIAAKGGNPFGAIRESVSLLRKTWGEQLIGATGLGFLTTIAIVLLILLGIACLFFVNSAAALGVLVTVFVLLFLIVIVISSTLEGIFRTAVYHYAVTHEVAPQYDASLIQSAFRPQSAPA